MDVIVTFEWAWLLCLVVEMRLDDSVMLMYVEEMSVNVWVGWLFRQNK